jgi:class 3 adenylate cyclase
MMAKDAQRELLLLLSIDIVGSAAFKDRSGQSQANPIWVSAFAAFYTEVPRLLAEALEQVNAGQSQPLPAARLWKAIGDQLVFLARPQTPEELECYCLAFLRCLKAADDQLGQAWGFALHGVAWAFEEGGANVTYHFGDLQLDGPMGFDLIGPDVDLGFRLMSLAPPGEVLAPLEFKNLLPQKRLRLELDGEASLKGIRMDPYPLLKLHEVDVD